MLTIVTPHLIVDISKISFSNELDYCNRILFIIDGAKLELERDLGEKLRFAWIEYFRNLEEQEQEYEHHVFDLNKEMSDLCIEIDKKLDGVLR